MDIVALEDFHEDLGHPVALRILDRREAGLEIERQSDLDRLVSCKDRSLVREPLHPMRRPDASKSALDALDHHVADHLAGDARGCGVTSIFQNVSEIGEVGHAFLLV
jgi:hypothetical protein